MSKEELEKKLKEIVDNIENAKAMLWQLIGQKTLVESLLKQQESPKK